MILLKGCIKSTYTIWERLAPICLMCIMKEEKEDTNRINISKVPKQKQNQPK